MKTIFEYQGKKYGYTVKNTEVIVYRIKDLLRDDNILDQEMIEQLEEEFEAYEATLNEEEMKVWLGE